ncbi:glucose-6-phosphate dehydrogenase [Pelagerythrobacter marinus]|jgi:glucose-6-phosphate 1-dehydrogenase|uniref:Glucose-6-phosphate 1-dehydrogenase n=1 Tax=Pelagerythrobacter marinus TaxID=538382 RepID=A0ABW9V0Q6_9SPHN|nr:glucose-6-phosphate dehydrogenase [Pelagerythrobacter marinus]MXO69302.1 glucose-6-phosphate dehydrogenase [Pelagerythrobacter marinus]USA39846.1 glucose-6-phosphate dehydrogenase [Pelagerythrobacter marinus]WPZ06023.1 glucose-6-phosphate dehydrogenase [Pelagerythrobacter marinus]
MSFTADRLVLFGATGDLAQRMLLPSLCALDHDGLLAPDLKIVGTARSDLDEGGFRNFAREALETYLPANRRGGMADFLNRLTYQPLDATTLEGYNDLAARVGEPARGLAIFLSTAPSLFEPTIRGLQHAGLDGPNVRMCLEKPLGTDLATSCEINDAVAAAFPEERIFRIDHYLGKETVQNLLALRFANILFEPLWNAAHIEHVQITVAETVGLEGRVAFYDDAGALRDMVQNHMLQLLALVAMEPPGSFDATAVRDEKVKVLRSLRRVVEGETVTGQYRAGAIQGEAVPGYDEELGRVSDTETFVAIKAHVDNWRWKGVPFYLRTGKRMPERVTEIVVQFRPIPHSIFEGKGAKVQANKLVIGIQPEENITLSLMAKVPGLDREGIRLRSVPLNIAMPHAFSGAVRRIAYERLLLDLLEGDQTLFVRRDEVEAQWEWIDAIRAGWAAQGLQPRTYMSGSWGPSAAIALAERDGVTWHE